MMQDAPRQTALGFLNLRKVMAGTPFYCKTLEKRLRKAMYCTFAI